MKKLIITSIIIATSSICYGYSFAHFLTTKEAEKKWGVKSFSAKVFKTETESTKGAMAVDLIKKNLYIGQPMIKLRTELGAPDSYFFSDTVFAYEITPPQKNKEQWQLLFIPDENLTNVKEVKINKKCCDKEAL
ncbi:MAG: hypothetical protein ACOYOK_13750 [Pseudobdellovibrionaceae bacterium]|jgi:hypothetical protein